MKISAEVGGRTIETYALLDDCSDVSLCDKRLVERLGLLGKEKPFQITTVNKQTEMTEMEVNFTVASLDGSEHIQMERVLTINRLPVSSRNNPN